MNSNVRVWIVILAASVALGVNSCRLGENEIFVVPAGFKGPVFIVFSQSSGQPPKYDNGQRIYDIPQDGILITQFSPNNDWHRPSKFFFRDNSKLIEIPEVEGSDLRDDRVQACCLSFGKTGRTANDWSIEYYQVY